MIISFQSADAARAHEATQRALERCRAAGFGQMVGEASERQTADLFNALRILVDAAPMIVTLAKLLAPAVREFFGSAGKSRMKFETNELSLELIIKVQDEERVQLLLRKIFEALVAQA